MNLHLEDRLHALVDNLSAQPSDEARTSVSRRTRRLRRRRQTRGAVGGGALVVLVIAGLLALQGAREGAEQPAGPVDQPDVSTGEREPRLVVDVPPAGLQQTVAYELPTAEEIPGIAGITVYGDPSAEDPFAAADLAIVVTQDETMGLGGDPIAVRGQEGQAGDTAQNPEWGDDDLGLTSTFERYAWLSWDESDDLEITVVSRHLEVDQLVAVAEGAEVSGASVALDDLPEPLQEVGSIDQVTFDGQWIEPASAEGHVISYLGGPAAHFDSPFTSVATFAADEQAVGVLRWAMAGREVGVRGGRGWVAEVSEIEEARGDAPGSGLVWEEAPGVVGYLRSTDLTPDELRALAEDLRPATDDEWNRAVAAAPQD